MLLNGVLYNSEAWHGLTSAQVVIMEQLDESFLRGILNAHGKTAKEFYILKMELVQSNIFWHKGELIT